MRIVKKDLDKKVLSVAQDLVYLVSKCRKLTQKTCWPWIDFTPGYKVLRSGKAGTCCRALYKL